MQPSLRLRGRHLFLALRFALALGQHLLDNLLLLDQESAHDAVSDAVGAAGTTIRTADGLLCFGDGGVLAGAEGWDLYNNLLVVWVPA